MAVRGWENSEATMTARGAVPTSMQLCRDAVPTLPSAAEPQYDSGWRLGKQRDSGCDVIASLPDAICCHLPPEAMHHSKGDRRPGFHFQVSGLGRQVPGSGAGSGPAPVPEPEDPYLIPDG
jgi:hypothetical protein